MSFTDLRPLAPEYALDELLLTASDMYSLGCLIYAVHCKGKPPFQNHGSLGGLREHAARPPPNIEHLDPDLQGDASCFVTWLLCCGVVKIASQLSCDC